MYNWLQQATEKHKVKVISLDKGHWMVSSKKKRVYKPTVCPVAVYSSEFLSFNRI